MSSYSTIVKGKKYSTSFKVFITQSDKIISPFHSIDLYQASTKDIVTVVNEIPRFENAKFEISKDLEYNPITQDVKKGSVRFVSNVYPFKGYLWNYGALPMTWEDKDEVCEYTKCKGDNDPIDVIDIGKRRKEIGEVYQAKVLGCLALIDDGECDWKIIVIDVNDESSKDINDIEDVNPKLIEDTFTWFKVYKVPDNGKFNEFGLDNKIQNKEFALKIIDNAHESWKKLFEKKHVEKISYQTSKTIDEVNELEKPAEKPAKVYEFYFLKN